MSQPPSQHPGEPRFPQYAQPTGGPRAQPPAGPADGPPDQAWFPPQEPPGPPRYPGAEHGLPPPVPPPGSSRTNGFAIAGFVLGLVGAIVLAPIFSILALRKIKRTGESGKGFAIAGLVLAGCWLLLFVAGGVAAVVLGDQAGDGDTTAVSNVRVGQCFDADMSKNTLLVVKIADCAKPHSGEAYDKVKAKLTGMGTEEQELTATQECANSFESFVGKSFQESELEIVYVALEERELADGNILCMLAGKPGEKLTGSMRGARR
jgi:Domain of unknown function (DUF4190)/Septum formation